MSDTTDVHTGTDRVELTEDEREALTSCCNRSDCQGTFAAVESIIAGRLAAPTAELDDHRTLHADMVDQAKVMDEHIIRAEAEIEELQAQVDAHWRDLLGLKAERDAARAELAAANARCAELEAERDVLRGPWRDSLEAWNTYNEGFGYSGDFDRPIMAAFRTGFDTGRAERDALRATLDRVTALAKDWDTYASGIEVTKVAGVRFGKLRDVTRILRAALTPEGTE